MPMNDGTAPAFHPVDLSRAVLTSAQGVTTVANAGKSGRINVMNSYAFSPPAQTPATREPGTRAGQGALDER
jgi:hypothetical protein